jgi:WD40 repeat protein
MAADPARLKLLREFSNPGILFCLARRHDPERLYFGSSDFNLYELDPAAEKPEPLAFTGDGHQSYVTGMALAGDVLVTGSYDGRLIWWDLESRAPSRTLTAHDRWIRRVIATPDGRFIASVADDMLCKLWDARTGEPVRTLTGHEPVTPHHYPSMLFAIAAAPDHKHLATADKVGHVVVWEIESGAQVATLEAPVMYTWDPRQRRHSIGGIRALAFSPDSKLLAAGGIGQIGNIDHLGGPSRVEVFDWRSGKRLLELEDEKYKGLVQQLRFGPTGEWFLVGGGDNAGFVTFYETATGKILHQDKAPMHVHDVAFSPDHEVLSAVGHERIVIWELKAPAGETEAS